MAAWKANLQFQKLFSPCFFFKIYRAKYILIETCNAFIISEPDFENGKNGGTSYEIYSQQDLEMVEFIYVSI